MHTLQRRCWLTKSGNKGKWRRKWQRDWGAEKERRTEGINVSLLMFVCESPQLSPWRSSATGLTPQHPTLHLHLSLHSSPQFHCPPSLQGWAIAVTNPKKRKKGGTMWHVLMGFLPSAHPVCYFSWSFWLQLSLAGWTADESQIEDTWNSQKNATY